MSTETNPITDAELIRYLDGELDASSRSALAERLASAPEAAARLEALRRRSSAMSQLMRNANPSGPATRASADAIRPLMVQRTRMHWMPLLRIAAVIAVLLVGVAVPPVRAWLLTHLLGIGSVPSVETAPTSASAPEAATPPSADVVYNFTVTADTFDLEVTQAAGTLVVKRSADGSASAEARAPGTSFLVLPRGLRIEGPASAQAHYNVALPATVQVLRLRRPRGVSVQTLSGADLTIDLARR